jgi:uncharacterized membrane protein
LVKKKETKKLSPFTMMVIKNILFALGLSILLVIHSRRKKSLSIDGASAAFALGMATFSSQLWVFTVVLLTFFISSSKLTHFKAQRKRVLEADYEASSERNAIQVACNGLAGGLAVVLFQYLCEPLGACYHEARWSTMLLWAYVGHYACCAGDTVEYIFVSRHSLY